MVQPITEQEAIRALPKLLSDLVDEPVQPVPAGAGAGPPGLVVNVGNRALLVIEVKGRDELAVLEHALDQAARLARDLGGTAVLAVPYMGPKARAWAAERQFSWMDLCGNADIRSPGLRIVALGRPNRFSTRGRPATVFSPAASRISRVMLIEPEREWTQAELVDATELSRGFVSKVVRRMLSDRLVERVPGGDRVRVPSPDLLLDAWAQRYRFDSHAVRRFHVVARTGAEAIEVVAERLRALAVDHAATGLAGAWLLDRWADFRLATFYVESLLDGLEASGIRTVERGENLWLAVPNDAGVLTGAEVVDGVRVVHPVQCWLDLQSHHERAKAAAEHLRAERLRWRE